MKRGDIHIRDPFVFAENGTYYLLGTTGDNPWGKGSDLTLYVSADLEYFEKKCVMITDGSLDSYTNIWAPELHKYDGKYYEDIELLNKHGYEVLCKKESRSNAYYVIDRKFERSEVQVLLSAVGSAKSLSNKKTVTLMQKLYELLGVTEAEQLRLKNS